jgi:hypothetical protein
VAIWLGQLGFDKNIDKVMENKIDGKMVLKMESINFASIIGIKDENDVILLTKSMDLLKKLHNQNDYLKSITKSSFKQNKDQKPNDLEKMKKIIESRYLQESENNIKSYQENPIKKDDNITFILKDTMMDKDLVKEEDTKKEALNEGNTKLDRMNELEQTHGKRNLIKSFEHKDNDFKWIKLLYKL